MVTERQLTREGAPIPDSLLTIDALSIQVVKHSGEVFDLSQVWVSASTSEDFNQPAAQWNLRFDFFDDFQNFLQPGHMIRILGPVLRKGSVRTEEVVRLFIIDIGRISDGNGAFSLIVSARDQLWWLVRNDVDNIIQEGTLANRFQQYSGLGFFDIGSIASKARDPSTILRRKISIGTSVMDALQSDVVTANLINTVDARFQIRANGSAVDLLEHEDNTNVLVFTAEENLFNIEAKESIETYINRVVVTGDQTEALAVFLDTGTVGTSGIAEKDDEGKYGRITRVIQDSSLTTANQIQEEADKILAKFGTIDRSIGFATYNIFGLAPGDRVAVWNPRTVRRDVQDIEANADFFGMIFWIESLSRNISSGGATMSIAAKFERPIPALAERLERELRENAGDLQGFLAELGSPVGG